MGAQQPAPPCDPRSPATLSTLPPPPPLSPSQFSGRVPQGLRRAQHPRGPRQQPYLRRRARGGGSAAGALHQGLGAHSARLLAQGSPTHAATADAEGEAPAQCCPSACHSRCFDTSRADASHTPNHPLTLCRRSSCSTAARFSARCPCRCTSGPCAWGSAAHRGSCVQGWQPSPRRVTRAARCLASRREAARAIACLDAWAM